MVMATGSVCQQFPAGELSHEAGETSDDASAEGATLHEQLVAYVHALAGGHEPRSGVWVEHSYARSRGSAHAPASHVRVLLAPRHDTELGDAVDVERVEPPPPDLPATALPPDDRADSDDDDDDEWEARVTALAPSAVHARLAEQALDTLRRMRLERLVEPRGYARPEAARAASRRLRLALATAATHPAAHMQRPAVWLHATLHAYMPRTVKRLYDELAAELRRAAPRLAERMMCGSAPPPRRDPLRAVGPALPAGAGPWLVWLGSGRARLDARWARRLGALLHTRVLPAASAACAAPDVWCAAVAGSVRAALADTLVEAGERPVILGGVGAGAALCTTLAANATRVRGLLLLAPPLLTAEGPRDTPDDPLAEIRLPMLVVVGTGAAQCWRGAARDVTRARPDAPPRRVLELRGADDALRLPAALRRRRRLPQHALDAAVAEECARWAIETAMSPGGESPARERPRRREARASGVVLKNERVFAGDDDEEEYAHLPTTRPAPTAPPAPSAPAACLTASSVGSDRPIEIVGELSKRRGLNSSLDASNSVTLTEGRVVSRGPGGTPLALLPPRRRAPSPLAAADIMRLPIVFADDEPASEPGAPASAVTVTSGVPRARARGAVWARGAARYTRVIVASRGAASARPVLLRRGVRLLPRETRPH